MQARTIALDAAEAIDFKPTVNTATFSSSNSANSSRVGLTLGFGQQNGISLQVGASNAQGHCNGNGNGQETTYTNSQIIASDALTTKSTGDTRLIGTQLAGNTVKMEVGASLSIQTTPALASASACRCFATARPSPAASARARRR